jgi:putative CocE/NonD family hydrolase
VAVICASYGILWAQPFEGVIDRDARAPMHDGVILRADIYRPKGDGRFPVVVLRTPYNKTKSADFGMRAAAGGYIGVIQDVRGRYGSDGEWYPFRNEPRDGYDTVEWAATLPGSNGKVALFGGSYRGATVMLAAAARPPHLAAILTIATSDSYYDGWTYQNGALKQWFVESWTSILAVDSLDRQTLKQRRLSEWAQELPVSTYPVLAEVDPKRLAPYFQDWLRHSSYDRYWKDLAIDHAAIKVPSLHVAGWYDVFKAGSLRNYRKMCESAGRDTAKLVIGPWTHGGVNSTKGGELDFGASAKLDFSDLALRWFDSALKDAPPPLETRKPVRLFVMGENVWRDEDEWPLARAKHTAYYLHSDGKANSRAGDGKLDTKAPAAEPADHFVYDPRNPVPTRGGELCCTGHPAGVADQRQIEERPDILVYSTQPFPKNFEITGDIAADLYITSSTVDTDFTAKLVDVWPNGFAQNLTAGILRARYRRSLEKAELLTPGQITRIRVELGATSNVFLAGHRLRIEISSSNFPAFDRNLNTGDEPGFSARMTKSTNRVLHDSAHASSLILPVVPR